MFGWGEVEPAAKVDGSFSEMLRVAEPSIDLQKMFRARLRRNRTQRFAVTRHQGGNGLWRLGKVQQRVVHSCL